MIVPASAWRWWPTLSARRAWMLAGRLQRHTTDLVRSRTDVRVDRYLDETSGLRVSGALVRRPLKTRGDLPWMPVYLGICFLFLFDRRRRAHGIASAGRDHHFDRSPTARACQSIFSSCSIAEFTGLGGAAECAGAAGHGDAASCGSPLPRSQSILPPTKRRASIF